MQYTKLDAAEGIYFSRQLEEIKSKQYDVKYGPLKYAQFLPIDSSISPAAENVTYRQWDQVGMAKIVASYAHDFPRADVLAKEYTGKIKSLGASYGYNVQEIRGANAMGIALDQKKANAAKRAIDQKIEAIAQLGDTATGLLGLLNQPNAATYTVPADGTGASALWSTKTGEQIVRDMFGASKSMVESTLEAEQPDTLLIPLTRYGVISTTPFGVGNGLLTVLQFFLATEPYIKAVFAWSALDTAGAGGTARMVAYRRDPDAVELRLPIAFESFPAQERGMEFVIMCHARIGGVVAYLPKTIVYADGI